MATLDGKTTNMISFKEACKLHPDFKELKGNVCILQTTSNAGAPLIIRVNRKSIKAYRAERAIITQSRYSKEGVFIDTVPELEDYFNKTPVMIISKSNEDGLHNVDFEAGFQRGNFSYQEREELCDELPSGMNRINTNLSWLKWIGLTCDEPLIDSFVAGTLEV